MKHPLTRILAATHGRDAASREAMNDEAIGDEARDQALRLCHAEPGAVIEAAGPGLAALFGHPLARLPFAWLFRAADRDDVERLAGAVLGGGTACILSARAPGIGGAALEGLLLPADEEGRAEGVLAPFGPAGALPLASLTLVSFRFVGAGVPAATFGFGRADASGPPGGASHSGTAALANLPFTHDR